ncbi:MAG: SDR family oxidoreductase [Calditrichaeota bacterium]|nr:SDR family oxidoreductase [Calditrichota bacterium]
MKTMTKPVAIITAASQGMGAACARELSKRGYSLVLMSRSDSIKKMSDELDAIAVTGDLNQLSDLEKLVDTAIDKFGRIDSLVISSGHPPKGELGKISDDDWLSAFNLLFLSVVRLCRLTLPHMLKQKSGSIAIISSFGAKEPSLSFPTSSVIRSSLLAYCKLFSQQYGGSHLRMNCILPGFIDSYPVDPKTIEQIPMKRPGTVTEIAKTAAFLISDDAQFINGQSIFVDGGMSRSI